MTVIAAYSDGPVAFLLADTLTTTSAPSRNGEVILPISSYKISAGISLNSDWETYLADYRQKITLVNDHLAIAWCGTTVVIDYAAKCIKEDLQDFRGDKQQLAEGIVNVLNKIDPIDRKHFSFIALGLTTTDEISTLFHMSYNVQPFDVSGFPHQLLIDGSGTEVMLNNIRWQINATYGGSHPDLPSQIKYLGYAIGAVGIQYFNEIINASGLDMSFGGPFELVVPHKRDDGSFCLQRSPEIAFSYWETAQHADGQVGLGFHATIIYQKYLHHAIITATEYLELSVDDKGEFTPISSDINMSVIPSEGSRPFKADIEAFMRSPVFRPELNAVYFIERVGKQFKVLFRLEGVESEFFLYRDGKHLKIKMGKEILDSIAAWYASGRK